MHPTDLAMMGVILATGLVGIAALPWRERDLAATERAAWVVRDLAITVLLLAWYCRPRWRQ